MVCVYVRVCGVCVCGVLPLGSSGFTGGFGNPGRQGDTGIPGSPGTRGNPGLRGAPGWTGPRGQDGLPGIHEQILIALTILHVLCLALH